MRADAESSCYRIMYRFLVPGWSAKPLVSAHDRIMGTHTRADATAKRQWNQQQLRIIRATRCDGPVSSSDCS